MEAVALFVSSVRAVYFEVDALWEYQIVKRLRVLPRYSSCANLSFGYSANVHCFACL